MIASPKGALDDLADTIAPDPLEAFDADDHDERLRRKRLGETPADRITYAVSSWIGILLCVILHLGGMGIVLATHGGGLQASAMVGVFWVSLILQMALAPKVLRRIYLATLEGRHRRLAQARLLDDDTYGLDVPTDSSSSQMQQVGHAQVGKSAASRAAQRHAGKTTGPIDRTRYPHLHSILLDDLPEEDEDHG